jgi:hypothetical protein
VTGKSVAAMLTKSNAREDAGFRNILNKIFDLRFFANALVAGY